MLFRYLVSTAVDRPRAQSFVLFQAKLVRCALRNAFWVFQLFLVIDE